MHTESLTVLTVGMILLIPSWLVLYFFIFQLCKIVWGNYVLQFSIWAPSWENPRGQLQTACANNKGADQPRSLINAFVVRYLEKYDYLGCCISKNRGFWVWAGQFLSNLIDRNPRRQVFKRRSPNSKTGGFQEYILFLLKIIDSSCSVESLLSMTFTL